MLPKTFMSTVQISKTGTPNETGAISAIFTISRDNTSDNITVFFDISGTAQQNIDYDIQGVRTLENTVPTVTFDGEKGSVVIPKGQTSVDIKITPRDDVVADAGETVTLTLTEEPTGAPDQYDVSLTPGDETATLTITDNTNPSSKVVGANEIIISNNADGANAVFAADVDGDGDVDVLSASREDNKIVLYETVSTPTDLDLDNNIIEGTPGRDTLTGTDDNDVIIGFQGRDIITGGEGEDQFVYINMRDRGDIITDFEVGSDKIVLTELFNSIGYSGSSPINDGYVSFSSQGENTVLLIDEDGTGGLRASNLLKVENVNIDLFNNSDNFVF